MNAVNHPACYLILRDGDKILFVLRENTGFMDGKYSLPAGRVEHKERFSAGAVREAFEEVGIEVDTSKIKHVHTAHRYAPHSELVWVDVYFEAPGWQGIPVNNEPHKHKELAWLRHNELPDNVMPFQLHALRELLRGESYSEIGWDEA